MAYKKYKVDFYEESKELAEAVLCVKEGLYEAFKMYEHPKGKDDQYKSFISEHPSVPYGFRMVFFSNGDENIVRCDHIKILRHGANLLPDHLIHKPARSWTSEDSEMAYDTVTKRMCMA